MLRVTPQVVTKTGPDRVDSGGNRRYPEGRGQHDPCCGSLINPRPSSVGSFIRDFETYDILPCMHVPRSTIDTSYPIRDIHTSTS